MHGNEERPLGGTEWRIWAEDIEHRMGRVESDLRENNLQTQEVHEIIMDAKGFFRFLGRLAVVFGWIAKVGAGVAAVWALVAAFKSGSPPKL